jgi:hypothetical protein
VREKGDQSGSSTDCLTYPQASGFSSSGLSFLICKMKIIIPVLPSWQVYCEH